MLFAAHMGGANVDRDGIDSAGAVGAGAVQVEGKRGTAPGLHHSVANIGTG
jgi:hypothetical protein